MSPTIATGVCVVLVLGMIGLDRDGSTRTSKALWIAVAWVALAGSRMVSQWLGLWSPIELPEQALEGNSLDRNIQAGLIAAAMMVLLARGREVWGVLRANGPIVWFFLYCAASILWSDYPDIAFKRWTKAVGDVAMVLIVVTDRDWVGAVKDFLARIGFLLVPASVLLIKYYPDLGKVYSTQEGEVRYVGVTMNKNLLGVVCLISGVGCVWRLIEAWRGREGSRRAGPLIAQGAVLAMVLGLFRIGNAMTPLACFVLAVGLLVATHFRALTQRRAVVHLLVGASLGVAFAALFLDVGTGLVRAIGRDSTLTGRTELWENLLRLSQHPLLGSGFESFWFGSRLEELWARYWWHPNEAHNGYLEVFLNLGWVGVALFGLVVATGYRNAIGAFRRDPHAGGLRLALFVAGVAYGFTEAAFRVLNPVWIVFLLAIVAVPRTPAAKSRVARAGVSVALQREVVSSASRVGSLALGGSFGRVEGRSS